MRREGEGASEQLSCLLGFTRAEVQLFRFGGVPAAPCPLPKALEMLNPKPPTPRSAGTMCISGSIDCTARLWDVRSGRCLSVKQGHTDEVLDVSFDSSGAKFVSASADGTARIYNSLTGVCMHTLIGHEGEISKVAFNPQGSRVITASSDKTCRLWDTDSGECLQLLEGHTDEIFSCAFNYEGDFIITGSKDNTCRIWRAMTAHGSDSRPGYAIE